MQNATIGLASVTLSGCWTSGNLVAPPPEDAGRARDAGADAGDRDAGSEHDAGDRDASTDDAGSESDASTK